jgi:hypothetical protein
MLEITNPEQAHKTYPAPLEDGRGTDLAARLITARYGLPAHVAELVCSLAGLGAHEAR